MRESAASSLPIISVIVPVYNRKRYLRRCVESLVGQTYRGIEIVLVDDGSTDGSSFLCDELSRQYPNIVVAHQVNQGSGAARNHGLRMASGEYIGFVDSDDWVASDMFALLYDMIKGNAATAAQIDLCVVDSFDVPLTDNEISTEVLEGKACLERLMYESASRTGAFSLCRCLFSCKVLESVSFREGVVNEDIDFKYKAFMNCDRVVFSSQVKYFYFQEGESNSNGGLRKKDFDLYKASKVLMELSKGEEYGEIRRLVEVKSARTPLSLLCKVAYYGIGDTELDKKKVVGALQGELRGNLLILLSAPLPASRKALAILFSINYKLTEFFIQVAQSAGLG